jgi:hypothetical protein
MKMRMLFLEDMHTCSESRDCHQNFPTDTLLYYFLTEKSEMGSIMELGAPFTTACNSSRK